MKNNQKIPEGWSIKKLGLCLSLLKDGTHIDVPNGIMLLSAKDVINGQIILSKDSRRISIGDFNLLHKKYHIQNGDVVLTIVGTIGRCAIIDNYNDNYTFQRSVAILRPYKEITSKYLLTYIQGSSFQKELLKRQSVSAQPGVYLDDLSKIYLLLPPLPEQEKIAEILGTWDEAIEKLSSLIEQKKLLKKGLMQKLLTGKVRLPGSTRPWKEVKLGEIFNIKKGQGLSKEVLDDNGLNKCILYGELYTKYSEVIKDIESRTNQSGGILSQIGDILIPASTTTTGIDLANATALLKENVLLGGDINILRAKKEVSSIFFAYLLTHAYKFDIAKLAQGITIVHLYGEFLKNMKVYIPSDISEQQAIANVLSTADDEIYLLNKKLMMFKEQKKGLMQQLLTGTIRVKVN